MIRSRGFGGAHDVKKGGGETRMKTAMRVSVLLCLIGVLLAIGAGPAAAQPPVRGIGDRPAATLLLPYFEVDLGNNTGLTTKFSINNASANATIAHVVVWSDLAVPVLAFNVYLTGYDVQAIDMRDILKGKLSQTASVGQDPFDTISPQGSISSDVNYASCSGQLPPAHLPASQVNHLRAALTGQFSSLLGGCAGRDLGDNHARGYVTADTVNNCTSLFPGDAGYFGGDVSNDNILWGDYIQTVPTGTGRLAAGEALVHIRADAADPDLSTSGRYTFYGRYVNWTAIDNREPLATSFAARFLNRKPADGGLFPGKTSLVVWRDPKVAQQAFACPASPGVPSWFPLTQQGIVVFDEQEHPQIPPIVPVFPPPPTPALIPFPGATQQVKVDGPDFPIPFDDGWLFLNLNFSGNPNPPVDAAAAQAWVTVRNSPGGVLSVGHRATQFDSARAASHFIPQ